jgi:hypothetical protein
MIRFAAAAFLIAHGLVHIAIYSTPKYPSKPEPFDPARSWVLAGHVGATPMRSASLALGYGVAAVYATAGWTVALDAAAWPGIAALGGLLGIALKGLWFHPWLSLGIALDVAVLVAAFADWPASL